MNLKEILNALPILAKLTDGFVAVTDSEGSRLKVIDSAGNSIKSLENRKLDLAAQSIEECKVISGPSELARDAEMWTIPLGDFAIVVTDDGKKYRQAQIENSLKESLPLIANVIGGEASIFNEIGEMIYSINHDGSINHELTGQLNKDAYDSISLNKSNVIKSSVLPGGKSILIPISKELGLELSTLSLEPKRQEEIDGFAKYNFIDIIGKSTPILEAKELSKKAAKSKSSVLLLGESGTGKELFAQSIHNASDRKQNKFIAINCGAIPESLIESILFGYEKGTFTGANPTGKKGLFLEAHKGTIFLDEIGEMDPVLQTRLLRVLQEQEVTPLGGTTSFEVDVRIIAGTNQNLTELINEGKFREDLYYRLNVFPIKIPSLKERKEDIQELVSLFIKNFNIQLNTRITGCSKDLMKALSNYDWPGNIRQLRNSIERAAIVADVGYLEEKHLPEYIFDKKKKDLKVVPNNKMPLDKAIKQFETEYIYRVLEKTQYNRQEAAKQLEISTTTLWRKLNQIENEVINDVK